MFLRKTGTLNQALKKKEEAMVLVSGGLDSTVALYWAIKKRGFRVRPLTFHYYRRSSKESAAMDAICKIWKLNPIRISLDFLKEIEDARKESSLHRLRKLPPAYIPCRNVIFYGIAVSFSELYGCKFIVGGHNKEDPRTFPDSGPTFFEQFNKTTSLALITHPSPGRVILPLSKLSKSEVIRLGESLKVPFEKTWSCYREGPRPCARCSACKLRRQAFREARIQDPLELKARS